jgi:hypothetical protein
MGHKLICYILFVLSEILMFRRSDEADHGKLNTWKGRLGAFSGNTFLFILLTNVFSKILRYATMMDAYQI